MVSRTVEQDNRQEAGFNVVRQGAPKCEKAYFKPKHVYLNLIRQSERATSETDLILSKALTKHFSFNSTKKKKEKKATHLLN